MQSQKPVTFARCKAFARRSGGCAWATGACA